MSPAGLAAIAEPGLSPRGLEDAGGCYPALKRFGRDVFGDDQRGRAGLGDCSARKAVAECWKSSCRGAESRDFQNGLLSGLLMSRRQVAAVELHAFHDIHSFANEPS